MLSFVFIFVEVFGVFREVLVLVIEVEGGFLSFEGEWGWVGRGEVSGGGVLG